jgi:hypothetical protein
VTVGCTAAFNGHGRRVWWNGNRGHRGCFQQLLDRPLLDRWLPDNGGDSACTSSNKLHLLDTVHSIQSLV